MSIEDAKDSVDGYEGHNEQGDPNVAVVEERNITEIDFNDIIFTLLGFERPFRCFDLFHYDVELTYRDANRDKSSHSHG